MISPQGWGGKDDDPPGQAEAATAGRPADPLWLLEHGEEAVVQFDRDWRYRYLNPAAERALRRRREDLLGRVAWEEYPDLVGTAFQTRGVAARATGREAVYEEFYAPLNTWFRVRAVPDPHTDTVTYFLRDVSPERQRRAQMIIDGGLVGILEWRLEGGVRDANDTFLEMVGYTRDDMEAGRIDWVALTPPEWREEDARHVAVMLREGRHAAYEKEYVHKSGRRVPILIGSALFGGSTDEGVSFLLDITHRKSSEAAVADAAQRERRFMRDLIGSMTEGKLYLVDREAELPTELPRHSEAVALTDHTVRLLRRQAADAAAKLGFASERVQMLETAVAEAAMNAVRHGGGGEGRVCASADAGTVQVWIADRGRGISAEALPRALEKGGSTAGSLGHGFFLILRSVDRCYLLTGPGGTCVVLEQNRHAPEPAWLHGIGGGTA
jgi:PAS domain S-box-containing protein